MTADTTFSTEALRDQIQIVSMRLLPGEMHSRCYALLPKRLAPDGILPEDGFFVHDGGSYLILGPTQVVSCFSKEIVRQVDRPLEDYDLTESVKLTTKFRDVQLERERKRADRIAAALQPELEKWERDRQGMQYARQRAEELAEKEARQRQLKDPKYVLDLERRLQALEQGKHG